MFFYLLILFILLSIILLWIYYDLIWIFVNEMFTDVTTRKDIEKIQKIRLEKILQRKISNIQHVLPNYPMVTKKDIPNLKGSYITAYTSGTSGNVVAISYNRSSFIQSQITTGVKIFKDCMPNHILNRFPLRMKMVFLISTNGTLTYLLAKKASLPISLLTQISIISFDETYEVIIKKLNAIQPHIIVSYPTFLETLLSYNNLKINPEIIVTGSECLTPIIRSKIENRFLRTKVIETYGCTECPSMAVSCRYNNLHLHEDCCIVELIDKNNNILPFKPGTISHRILITNLLNAYQPIVRYILEDSIEILEDCPCGSPFKTIKVHGRSDDIFNLIDDSQKMVKILPASIESSIFLNIPLSSYQVIHIKQNHLLILYVTDNEDCYHLLRQKIEDYLLRRNLTNVFYKLERRKEIQRQEGGKIRQIISLI